MFNGIVRIQPILHCRKEKIDHLLGFDDGNAGKLTGQAFYEGGFGHGNFTY